MNVRDTINIDGIVKLFSDIPDNVEDGYEDDSIYVNGDGDDNLVARMFLGTFMSLDPCGRYHHLLSLNELTDECEKFWEELEEEFSKVGLFIGTGEDDPCDIFVCKVLE